MIFTDLETIVLKNIIHNETSDGTLTELENLKWAFELGNSIKEEIDKHKGDSKYLRIFGINGRVVSFVIKNNNVSHINEIYKDFNNANKINNIHTLRTIRDITKDINYIFEYHKSIPYPLKPLEFTKENESYISIEDLEIINKIRKYLNLDLNVNYYLNYLGKEFYKILLKQISIESLNN